MNTGRTRFKKGNIPWNKGRKQISTTGERNICWKGDKASYTAIHHWVKRQLGKPEKCSRCGIRQSRIEWANISGKYRRDLSDYFALCPKCHKKYDHHSEKLWKTRRKKMLRKVLLIRKLYSLGSMTQREIGKKFGVTQSTISLIVTKKTWRYG